jgi:hypothetical protein
VQAQILTLLRRDGLVLLVEDLVHPVRVGQLHKLELRRMALHPVIAGILKKRWSTTLVPELRVQEGIATRTLTVEPVELS